MNQRYGIPLVNKDNIFEILQNLGIKPWPRLSNPQPLESYASAHPEKQQEIERFGPKAEAVSFLQPDGKSYTAYRSFDRDWATVFVLLPGDLVPIVAEWKQGAEELTLCTPAGIISKKDHGDLLVAGKREFEEETGIGLKKIQPLSKDLRGIPISCRKQSTRFLPCLGEIDETLLTENFRPGKTKLDETEFLKLVLVPLSDWIELAATGQCNEDSAISTTFLALKKIGRLHLI